MTNERSEAKPTITNLVVLAIREDGVSLIYADKEVDETIKEIIPLHLASLHANSETFVEGLFGPFPNFNDENQVIYSFAKMMEDETAKDYRFRDHTLVLVMIIISNDRAHKIIVPKKIESTLFSMFASLRDISDFTTAFFQLMKQAVIEYMRSPEEFAFLEILPQLGTLMASLDIPVLAVDRNRKVFLFNQRAEELYEISASEIIGADIGELYLRQGLIEEWNLRNRLHKLLLEGKAFKGLQARIVTKTGRRKDVIASVVPLISEKGLFLGVLTTLVPMDLKPRETLEEAIERMEKEEIKKNSKIDATN